MVDDNTSRKCQLNDDDGDDNLFPRASPFFKSKFKKGKSPGNEVVVMTMTMM